MQSSFFIYYPGKSFLTAPCAASLFFTYTILSRFENLSRKNEKIFQKNEKNYKRVDKLFINILPADRQKAGRAGFRLTKRRVYI